MRTLLSGNPVIRALLVLLIAGSTLAAKDVPSVAELQQQLKKVRTAELPAAAANLVVQAPSALKVTNAVNVVKAAILISPGSTLSVVGAVCQVAPAAAPAIVTAAIELQPKLKGAILSAAVEAAPAYRVEIVQATAGLQPASVAVDPGVGGGLRPAFAIPRITPLPPPGTPPNEIQTTTLEQYVGRRDYSRP